MVDQAYRAAAVSDGERVTGRVHRDLEEARLAERIGCPDSAGGDFEDEGSPGVPYTDDSFAAGVECERADLLVGELHRASYGEGVPVNDHDRSGARRQGEQQAVGRQ